MTVKLLAQWGDQPAGTLYTAPTEVTEAAMIAAGQATATLAGGVVWVPPGSSPGIGLPVYLDPVSRSLIDGDRNRVLAAPGYRTVLFGDSMTDTYESVVSGVTAIYDAATGVLTVTSAAHQQAVGWQVAIWNRNFSSSNKLFNVPVLSIPNANTFTVNIGSNLSGLSASDANWRYRPQSWRSAQNFVQWLQGASGQRFNIVYNGGASGDRADEAYARVQTDCLAYLPDVVVCQMPGINDLGAANTSYDLETIIRNRHLIVDSIVASGAMLVLLSTTPVASGEARATLQNMGKVIEMNRRLQEYVRGKSSVIFFDAWKAVVSPTDAAGLAAANFLRTTDSIHYSMRGGRAIGEALWAQISSRFPSNHSTLPASIIDSYKTGALTLSSVSISASGLCTATASATGTRVGDRKKITGGSPVFNEWVTILSVAGSVITFQSTNTPSSSPSGTIRMNGCRNLIDTPLWTTATGGTLAGGVSGVAASGIKANINAGSPTVVASVVSRSDGFGNDQQLVITSAAASNQVVLEADFAWAATEWPTVVKPGRRYVFEGELTLTGVNGSNLRETRPNLVAIVDGTTYQTYALNGYADGAALNSDLTAFHFRTAPMVLPAGAAVTNFKWQVVFTFSAAGTALTAKLGRCNLTEYET